MMPKKVSELVHELEQIGADKITQPNYKNRVAARRAARVIRDLYEQEPIEESELDS